MAPGVVHAYHKAPGSPDTGAWQPALSEARPKFQQECLQWHRVDNLASGLPLLWASRAALTCFSPHIGLDGSLLRGYCLVHYRLFSSIPVSTSSYNNANCPQTLPNVPGGQNHPQLRSNYLELSTVLPSAAGHVWLWITHGNCVTAPNGDALSV